MAINIYELKDKDGNKIYTQTHADAVVFSDGQTFQTKLDGGILKGDKGDAGPQGPAGANGQDGLTTSISVNGTTYTHVDGIITLPNYPTGTGSNNASDISITDTANNFTSTNVEDALAEASSQIKDIANLSLTKHTDGKVYIKKQDGTLVGTGVEVGSGTDLSKVTMTMSGQTLQLLNDGTQIASVEIPTATVTDEQLTAIIQAKIDDGTLSNLSVQDKSITLNKLSEDMQEKINAIGDVSQLQGGSTSSSANTNLFDKHSPDSKDNTWINATGQEISLTGEGITNYIPCRRGSIISRYVNNSLLPFDNSSIFLFDSNKVLVKKVTVNNGNTYTIVDDASYLRTWYDINNKDSFAIYDSTQPTIQNAYKNIIEVLQDTPMTISISDNTLTLKNYKDEILSQSVVNIVANSNEKINGVPINAPVNATNLFDKNSDDTKDNTWLDSTGNEINTSGGGITNYIPCYKGSVIARYANGVLSEFTDTTIFLFDSNKTFLQQIKPYNGEAYYVTNDNVAYTRVWYDIDKKDDTFICDLKYVDSYGKTDIKEYETVQNTDGAINMMLQTGREYAIDGNFAYGTDYTCLDDVTGLKESEFTPKKYQGTKYQIDCSSFVKVCMMGLTPQNSRYYTDKNTPSKYGYQWDDTVAEYVTTTEVTHTPQTGKYGRLYANKIAKYAWKKGYLYSIIDEDFSKVKAGDLVFWCSQPASYNYWENISHVAIVVETGYNAADIKIMEVVGNNTIAIRGLYNNNTIKYGARYPMPYQSYAPIELYSSNEESLNFTECITNTPVTIKQMQLNGSIIKGYTYTLIFKFTSDVSTYDISINCAGYTQNIAKNNNNVYVAHIFIPYNQSISDSIKNKLSINITPTTDINSLNINMEWCKVYKGYVSFSNESLI